MIFKLHTACKKSPLHLLRYTLKNLAHKTPVLRFFRKMHQHQLGKGSSDGHQNLIAWSLATLHLPQISSKSVYNFLRYFAHRHTLRYIDTQRIGRMHYLLRGGNIIHLRRSQRHLEWNVGYSKIAKCVINKEIHASLLCFATTKMPFHHSGQTPFKQNLKFIYIKLHILKNKHFPTTVSCYGLQKLQQNTNCVSFIHLS